jgi:hypothetical protein
MALWPEKLPRSRTTNPKACNTLVNKLQMSGHFPGFLAYPTLTFFLDFHWLVAAIMDFSTTTTIGFGNLIRLTCHVIHVSGVNIFLTN